MLHILHDGTGNLVGNVVINELASFLKIFRGNLDLDRVWFSQQSVKIDKNVFFRFFTQNQTSSVRIKNISLFAPLNRGGVIYQQTKF